MRLDINFSEFIVNILSLNKNIKNKRLCFVLFLFTKNWHRIHSLAVFYRYNHIYI